MKLFLVLVLRVLSMMALLAPHHAEHDHVAVAIASAVLAADALFKGDDDRVKTASLMVAVSFREGSFRTEVRGDKGNSYGTFQVHLPGKAKTVEGYTGDDLLADPNAQARVALRMLRESFRATKVCGSELGLYIAGPSCANNRAKRISADRMDLARWVRTHTKEATTP